MKNKLFIFKIVLVIISIYGAFTFLYFSDSEIGVSWDSVHYMTSAESFCRGEGFIVPILYWQDDGYVKPLTHYSPFYPFVIACVMQLGLTSFYAAYWLLFLLLALNIFLVSLIIYKIGHSRISAFIIIALLLCSRSFIGIHYAVLSDALFLFFFLLFIYLFLEFIEHRVFPILIGISIIAAFASLTRYVGITLILSGLVVLLIDNREQKRNIFVFLFGSILPLALWFFRSFLLTLNPFSRQFNVNYIISERICEGLATFFCWFFPCEIVYLSKLILAVLIFIALFYIALFIVRKSDKMLTKIDNAIHLKFATQFFIIFSVIYVVFLMISVSFFDVAIPFNNRIFSPIYVSFLIICCCWFIVFFRNDFFNNLPLKISTIFISTCFILSCLYNVVQFSGNLPFYLEHGFSIPQWNDSCWRESDLLNFLKMQKYHAPIFFSNAPDLIYLYTRNPSRNLLRLDDISRIDEFVLKVKETNGLVVYFHKIREKSYVSLDSLLSFSKTNIIFDNQEGTIFLYK